MSGKAGLPKRGAIIALMAIGSVALWIGDPALWFWITAQLQSTQPTMGPYVLPIVGITLTGVGLGKLLSGLNRLYGEVTGTAPTVKIVLPWRRSYRGESGKDEDARMPVSLLDVVMVISVVIAVGALVAWFIVVNPAPNLPGGPGGAKH